VFGQGAPLVLIHGTPFSPYVWRAIGRELARSFRIHVAIS
jgi:pimeloyl-ACP methyl ester carboxylesterase